MPSSIDLRRQAARCLRIAAALDDKSAAAALTAMADDLSAKADEIDPTLESKREDSADGDRAGGASR
jgi:hypothetical protein